MVCCFSTRAAQNLEKILNHYLGNKQEKGHPDWDVFLEKITTVAQKTISKEKVEKPFRLEVDCSDFRESRKETVSNEKLLEKLEALQMEAEKTEQVIKETLFESKMQAIKSSIIEAAVSFRIYYFNEHKGGFEGAEKKIITAYASLIAAWEEFKRKDPSVLARIKENDKKTEVLSTYHNTLKNFFLLFEEMVALDCGILAEAHNQGKYFNEIERRIKNYTAFAEDLKQVYTKFQPCSTWLCYKTVKVDPHSARPKVACWIMKTHYHLGKPIEISSSQIIEDFESQEEFRSVQKEFERQSQESYEKFLQSLIEQVQAPLDDMIRNWNSFVSSSKSFTN